AGAITEILQDVVRYGTGEAAALSGYDAAGKTGTTNSHRDAWFCGYTTEIVACVWMGFKRPRPMEDVHGIRVSGGSFPAQIWNKFMSRLPLPDSALEGGELDLPDGGGYVPPPPSEPTVRPSPQPTSEPTVDPTEDPSPPDDGCGILPIC
ncbi:MAG: penicillin-binding protein, partial [Actinobacteria bacterium]|nr:penicillin-binding protein [Actinomycetota bacterium]